MRTLPSQRSLRELLPIEHLGYFPTAYPNQHPLLQPASPTFGEYEVANALLVFKRRLPRSLTIILNASEDSIGKGVCLLRLHLCSRVVAITGLDSFSCRHQILEIPLPPYSLSVRHSQLENHCPLHSYQWHPGLDSTLARFRTLHYKAKFRSFDPLNCLRRFMTGNETTLRTLGPISTPVLRGVIAMVALELFPTAT